MGKVTMCYSNMSDTNRLVQSQKMIRGWKFWIKKVEELHHPCSENIQTAIGLAITAKLICVFGFAYADCWFSHEAAHFLVSVQQLQGKRCSSECHRIEHFISVFV